MRHNHNNVELLVFGAGQMRTGTASLKKALEYLYSGNCYHMEEVLDNASHIKLWQQSMDEKRLTRERADKIFRGYVAAVDNPAASFYRDLCQLYPNAKVILTVRDPDSWVRSVRNTTLVKTQPSTLMKAFYHLTGYYNFLVMCRSMNEMMFHKREEELSDDETLKQCFIKYNDEVKQWIPSDRLLVFESQNGWGPLCRFLGKDIPNVSYPKLNSANEFRKLRGQRINYYLSKLLVPMIGAGLPVLMGLFYVFVR